MRKNVHLSEKEVMHLMRLKLGGDKSASIRVPFKIMSIEHSVGSGLGCGKVDLIVYWMGRKYAVEVKGEHSCFWNATKCLAYAKVASSIELTHYYPAMLLPHDEIGVNVLTYAHLAGIKVFSWELDDGIIIVKPHNVLFEAWD